jgi:hypothetical protein
MNLRMTGALALVPFLLAPPKPKPYVSVYHDDAVTFQFRKDRIKPLGDGRYTVWLRWLWAKPRPLKGREEWATVIIAIVDCNRMQVQEQGVLHKDREAQIIDAEETLDKSPWKTFAAGSGAEASLRKVCNLIPEMIQARTP